MSPRPLEDEVCIVTGGARGIGLAVLERFLDDGARGVVAVDRDAQALAQLAERFPGRVCISAGDVRDPGTHQRAVALALEHFGSVSVLVANAGVFDYRKRIEAYTPELLSSSMDELFGINLKGYLLAVHAALAPLQESKGSIVLTGSVASRYAGGGGVLYTAAKHAVVGMVRQLAQELAPHIRVNAVAPGGTDTALGGLDSLGHGQRALNAREGFKERIAAHVPLGFAQTAADHAGAYAFLASRRLSPAITGEVLMSDGGVGIRHL